MSFKVGDKVYNHTSNSYGIIIKIFKDQTTVRLTKVEKDMGYQIDDQVGFFFKELEFCNV